MIWPTRSGRPAAAVVLAAVAFMLLAVLTAPLLELDQLAWRHALAHLLEFLGHLVTLPGADEVPKVLVAMAQTVAMAFVATVLTTLLSLPIGVLAAHNASPHPLLAVAVRGVLSTVRALPEVVWAILFASALGLGPLPGVMALTVVGVGLLGRLYAEALEVVDPRCVEGVRAHGAGGLQVFCFALLPQTLPDWVGSTLYLFDHNVRSAAILGLVGAGGIGLELAMAARLFRYGRLTLIVLAVWATIALLDGLSGWLRRRVI